MSNGVKIKDQKPPFKVFIRQHMCPGDALVATAAVESLHLAYPGQFQTMIRTTCQPIWDNNPRNVFLPPQLCHIVDLQYPAIHEVSQRQVSFMGAVCEYLGRQLGKPVPLKVRKPCLYLSEDEDKNRLKGTEDIGPYVVGNFGHKLDFTAKHAGFKLWQRVVDHFKGRLTFVQVGEKNNSHIHPPLEGVENFIGKTGNYRDLFRLAKHSVAGCGPVSFLLHVYGALDIPYVALAGGREESTWEAYNTTQYLHTLGQLDCCKEKACWKSRTVHIPDGNMNNASRCALPVLEDGEWVPKCLRMIGSEGVIDSLERLLKR